MIYAETVRCEVHVEACDVKWYTLASTGETYPICWRECDLFTELYITEWMNVRGLGHFVHIYIPVV